MLFARLVRRDFVVLLVAAASCGAGRAAASDDPALRRFFAEMRVRRLFAVAEGYALGRLAADAGESPTRRAVTRLELARTLGRHATLRLGTEREELFAEAERVLADVSDGPFAAEAGLVAAELTLFAAEAAAADRRYAEVGTAAAVAESYRRAVDAFAASETGLRLALNRRLAGLDGDDPAAAARLDALLRRSRIGLAAAVVGLAEVGGAGADLDEADRAAGEASAGWERDSLVRRGRLLRAEVARVRGRFTDARRILAGVEADPSERDLWNGTLLARARLDLAEDRAPEAAALLLGVGPAAGREGADRVRADRALVSDEGLVLGLVGLVRCVEIAAEAGDDALAGELTEAVEAEATRIAAERGGAWGVRARRVADALLRGRSAGREAAENAERAAAARGEGDLGTAARLFRDASVAAEATGPAVAWAVEAARLFVRLGDATAAAETLETAAAGADDSTALADAAATHWVAIESLAGDDRETFERSLRMHRVLFAEAPTRPAATARLATLLAADGRAVAAAGLYAELADDARFGPAARLAWIGLAGREESLFARLDAVLATLPEEPLAWRPRDAEFALRAADRLVATGGGATRVDDLLGRISAAAAVGVASEDPRAARFWESVASSAARRGVVAAVAVGDFGRARSLSEKSSSPADRFGIAAGLAKLPWPADPAARRTRAELAVAVCDDIRDPLDPAASPPDGVAARFLAEAHHAAGDDGLAARWVAAAAGRLAEPLPLVTTAVALDGPRGRPARRAVARAIQSAERRHPPGGEPWTRGRLALADLWERDGETEKARRLLKVTLLLHGGAMAEETREILKRRAGGEN